MHESFEYTPGAALAPYVERAVGYLHAGLPAGVHVGMPSCSLTLVVPLDEPLTLSDPAGPPRAFASVVAGLSVAPTHIHHHGYQHGVQLALRPAAARVLLGCRPSELAGSSVEAVDVLGPEAERLRERLHETTGWRERLTVVEQALAARLADAQPARPEVQEAWRLVTASGGRLPVRDVARGVGWSRRYLEQQFQREYGLTPKAAARVRRFERSVPLVSAARRPLSDVAALCGYADQAHLARDWRDLAGVPPSRWRAEDVLAASGERAIGEPPADGVLIDDTVPAAGPAGADAGRRVDMGIHTRPRRRHQEQP